MIFIALFRFGSREHYMRDEFTFIVDASSQEDAEMKLCALLDEAV